MNTRARVALVQRFCTPGAAARLLDEAAQHRRTFHAMREIDGFNVGSAAWRRGTRYAARASARDVLRALRLARERGKLHQPFKRSRGEA